MHSSKAISNKIKESEPSINKKPASTLRKKLSAIDPSPIDIEQSYLQFSIKNKKEEKKPAPIKKDAFIAPNNKIYNANTNKLMNESIHNQKSTKPTPALQMRPKSSNTDKYQKSIQIHSINQQQIKQQVRPGSSKSSRLFKKKSSTLANDEMRSDNDEDDSFIKVTNREKEFTNNAPLRERQRIGTSMSKKTRGGADKFQSKLDPEFFNLFAS